MKIPLVIINKVVSKIWSVTIFDVIIIDRMEKPLVILIFLLPTRHLPMDYFCRQIRQ